MTLTQKDYKEIQELVGDIVEEKIRFIPTKEEFFKRTDELMGELKDMREELKLTTGRVSIHSDEIEALQKIHPDNKHTSTV